jgi:nitrate/nitrite transporter NarK
MSRQPYRENAEFGAMVGRMIRTYGGRVADDIEGFADLVAKRAQLDAAIDEAAVRLHEGTPDRPGHSWAEIGRVLGITRQSARERFGREVGSS